MNVKEMTMDERLALLDSIEKDVERYGACCFCHVDTDGKSSMYVLRSKFKTVKSYSVNHGKPIPLHLVRPRQVVFILDFSFPVESIRQLQSMGCRIIHCDHHEAINTYPEDIKLEGNSRIEPGTSGVSLTYELLYPQIEKLPRVVDLIAKYDTWCLEDPDVVPFTQGFTLLDMEYTYTSDQTWLRLTTDNVFLEHVIEAGRHISIYDKTKADILGTEFGFKTEINGTPALAINSKNSNSKVLDVLDPEGKMPYRILYAFYGNIKQYRVGVYSGDETKYDASAFAREHGGDGRASAAGFVCKELPFKVPEPKDSFIKDYRDFSEPLTRMLTHDPLIRRHSDIQNRQIIRSIHSPINFLGWSCSFINNGLMTPDGWYLTGLNFQYHIGCIWSMMNNGWFRLVIYPLMPEISLEEIAKRSGGKIVNDSVIVYQKECPIKDLLA